VAANGDTQAKDFNDEAAENEGCPRDRGGKQNDSRHGEKKSGRHDEQSRVFHGLSFSISSGQSARPDEMEGRPPDLSLFPGPQRAPFVAENLSSINPV
jgi:hypothetical protein